MLSGITSPPIRNSRKCHLMAITEEALLMDHSVVERELKTWASSFLVLRPNAENFSTNVRFVVYASRWPARCLLTSHEAQLNALIS